MSGILDVSSLKDKGIQIHNKKYMPNIDRTITKTSEESKTDNLENLSLEYKYSIYPTQNEVILNYKDVINPDTLFSKFSIYKSWSYNECIDISQEQLCNIHSGVYYHFVCRSIYLKNTVKNTVKNTIKSVLKQPINYSNINKFNPIIRNALSYRASEAYIYRRIAQRYILLAKLNDKINTIEKFILSMKKRQNDIDKNIKKEITEIDKIKKEMIILNNKNTLALKTEELTKKLKLIDKYRSKQIDIYKDIQSDEEKLKILYNSRSIVLNNASNDKFIKVNGKWILEKNLNQNQNQNQINQTQNKKGGSKTTMHKKRNYSIRKTLN